MNLAQFRSAVPEIFHTQKVTDSAKNRTFRSSLRAVKTFLHRRLDLCGDVMVMGPVMMLYNDDDNDDGYGLRSGTADVRL